MGESIRISDMLKNIQGGHAWHGPNLDTILADISDQQALAKPIPNIHSIWEILLHMIAWREFCLEKLKKDPEFDIEMDSVNDWPKINDSSLDAWESTINRFKAMNEAIRQELQHISDEELLTTTLGRKYSLYTLVHGIAQHDTYHGGQIILLKKMVS